MRFVKYLFFAILFICFLPTQALTAENPLLEEGISLYRQENYDEALEVLKRVRKEDPKSTLAAYYLGLTYKQVEDYKHARDPLKDAITYAPKIKGALLELIEVLYQLGDLDEALHYVGVAEKEGIRPAQTAYLKGLVLLKQNRNMEAVEAFEEAKELDKALEQNADYQIGMAYMKEQKFGKAKDAFKEVVVLDPNSDTALFANRYMEAITRKEEAEKPFKFTVGTAIEYDDNVILMPSDASAVSVITDESDYRSVVTFRGEYQKKLFDRFKLKTQYSLYWAEQDDLDDYDVLSNSVNVTPSCTFERSSLNVPVGYNYTNVGGDSYLSTISVTPLYNVMLADVWMGQFFCKYQNKDFLKAPLNPNEDRDSHNFAAGAGLFYFFANNKGFCNVRYEFNREEPEGRHWEYHGNKVAATLLVPFWERIKVTTTGEAYFQDYENVHTTYGVEREDNIYTLSCLLTYEFIKNAEAQLRYTYVEDSSNIAVYDYDRHIVSGGVEYQF